MIYTFIFQNDMTGLFYKKIFREQSTVSSLPLLVFSAFMLINKKSTITNTTLF